MNLNSIIKFYAKSSFSQTKYTFSSVSLGTYLEKQTLIHQYKNAIRFENQQKIWNFKEINVINLNLSPVSYTTYSHTLMILQWVLWN